jgi:hypothetical protein
MTSSLKGRYCTRRTDSKRNRNEKRASLQESEKAKSMTVDVRKQRETSCQWEQRKHLIYPRERR